MCIGLNEEKKEFVSWFRSEFDPLEHSVTELIAWTEVNGRGLRRYRHYMAAVAEFVITGQVEKAFELGLYMASEICVFERAEDYLTIMDELQAAGKNYEADAFKHFVLGTELVDTTSCLLVAASLS